MADEVWEDVTSALSTILTTAEKSGNLKKELKNTISETVSTLRKLIVKLKDISDNKSKAITELQTTVTKMKAQYEDGSEKYNKGHAAPSLIPRQEPAGSSAQETAPPGDKKAKLYSTVLLNKPHQQCFKITVKSKDNHSVEAIKGILKSKINPTDIKVGINSFKALTDGRVLITTSSKEEAETLETDIKTKCGEKLEANFHRRRNPRLIILNIPEDITTENVEGTLITQNPDLNLKTGDINAKFSFVTKKHARNLVIEVTAQTRKLLLQKKVKLGWLICNVEDYLVVNRCFKCSKFNHRFQNCHGEETCPLCAGRHKLKDCTANPADYKCTNCATYNMHNKNTRICDKHSSLDRNCPSLQAVLERYRQNTEY